jgi:hypothetical protein
VNRIRYAPEVASRPDRLVKDLANAKTLATLLEDEAAKLRGVKLPLPLPAVTNGDDAGVKKEDTDATMAAPHDEDEEPEPKEQGSDAVERRIEKIMANLREQGFIDVNDDKAYEEKKVCSWCSDFYLVRSLSFSFFLAKVVVSLDLYLTYLRAAFHTCYYCAVVTDHLEELQRKCLKHARKPLSKMLLEELKAAEAEKERKVKDEDNITVDDDKEKSKERERESNGKQGSGKHNDSRDWKRNGLCLKLFHVLRKKPYPVLDERWLDWLDSKIALLINRDGVDPRVYGGKSYDE